MAEIPSKETTLQLSRSIIVLVLVSGDEGHSVTPTSDNILILLDSGVPLSQRIPVRCL